MPEFYLPPKIACYEILDELGRGAMGVVYKALDPRLQRIVALKVLPAQLAQNPEYVGRFHQEARAAARLGHPHIVTIYEIGEHEGLHYIAMEFVQGSELAQVIARRSPLPVARAVAIAKQIAAALSEAHRAGIVHRDIKPRNIMIDSLDQVKVMDFGVAKVTAELSTVETGIGKLIGTPAYMAPEQFFGGDVDQRCDIYALGVVMFQMLTGRTPHQGDTPAEIMQRVLSDALPELADLNPAVLEPLEACVRGALARDPKDRIQTADELRGMLERLPEPTAPEAGEPDTLPIAWDEERIIPGVVAGWRSRLPQRATKRGLALGAGGVLLGVIGLAVLLGSGGKPAGESVDGKVAAGAVGEDEGVIETLIITRATSATAATTATLALAIELDELRTAARLYSGVGGTVDEARAAQIVMRAADAGNPLAGMWRAWFTHWGRCGFKKDAKLAAAWGGTAQEAVMAMAAAGDADAQFLIGAAFCTGIGVAAQPELGLGWLREAAEQGQTTAMNMLGYVHYSGSGAPQDMTLAYGWFRRGAEAGDVNAMHNLGWMLANGEGTARDDKQALEWFQRGAEAASPANMNDVAWMMENGRGTRVDLDEAIRWYRKAAERGDALAAENLRKLEPQS